MAAEKPVTSEPENPPTAAEAKEGGSAPAPGAEIGSGSLFDLPAPAEGAPAAEKTGKPVEAEDTDEVSTEEPSAEPMAEERRPKPGGADGPVLPRRTRRPATDKRIPEGGSLFDL